jgi:hypothetical protein
MEDDPHRGEAAGDGSKARRWAAGAALVLLALGLLVMAFGAIEVGQGLAVNAPASPGLAGFFAAIGLGIVAIGVVHVVAALGIWAGRPSGRRLGAVCGLIGTLFGANRLPGAFDGTFTSLNGQDSTLSPPTMSSILSGLIVVPYLLVLIGLIVSGSHFNALFRSRSRISPGGRS